MGRYFCLIGNDLPGRRGVVWGEGGLEIESTLDT
jgi:hypothetical protein